MARNMRQAAILASIIPCISYSNKARMKRLSNWLLQEFQLYHAFMTVPTCADMETRFLAKFNGVRLG